MRHELHHKTRQNSQESKYSLAAATSSEIACFTLAESLFWGKGLLLFSCSAEINFAVILPWILILRSHSLTVHSMEFVRLL